ncbi:MAG: tetratricopeptide repeat protein [Bacteroidota bacterium]
MAKRKKPSSKPRPKKGKPSESKAKALDQPIGFWTNKKLHLIGIFVFAFVLYGNTLFNGYTQDDSIVIIENDFTTQGLAGIPDILSKDTFHGFFGTKKGLVAGGRYRPFSLVTFAFEYQFFGPSPFVGHLGNIIYYGLTGIVLYLLLHLLLNPLSKPGSAFPWLIALGATALFMAHPIHTEAVANIKGRDEIFALLGSLAALYFILRAFLEDDNKWYYLSGVIFFLALLSKENTITFLAIVPLAFYFFTKANSSQILKYTAPFLIASVVFIGIRTSVLGGFSVGDTPMELMNNPYLKLEGNTYIPFTPSEKLSTITYTMGKYIQLLVAPVTLTHDYYPKHVDLMPWTDWKVLLSLVFYLGLIGFMIMKFNADRLLVFGIFFFLATLSIVSNVVFPIGVHMSERFMYMPSVGFALVVAVLLYRLGLRLGAIDAVKSIGTFKVPMAILGVFLILFTMKTIHRNMAWKDNYTLFTTDVATSANSAKLQNAVGGEIIAKAIEAKNEALRSLTPPVAPNVEANINNTFMAQVETAVPHLKKAAEIHPTYANPYLQLGNAHNYLKRFDEAFQYYNIALTYKNPYTEATQNIGVTHKDAGEYYGKVLQDFNKAIYHLNEALKYDTNDKGEINNYLALCYASMGQVDKAIPIMESLVQLDPKNHTRMSNLAAMYNQRFSITQDPNDQAKAQQYLQQAQQVKAAGN